MHISRTTSLSACICLTVAITACSPKSDNTTTPPVQNKVESQTEKAPISPELEDAGKLLIIMNRAIDSIRRTSPDYFQANEQSFDFCQTKINSLLERGSVDDQVKAIRRCAKDIAENHCYATGGFGEQGSPECTDLHRELKKGSNIENVNSPLNMEEIVANRCKGNPEYQKCTDFEKHLKNESEQEKQARREALENERMKNMQEVSAQCHDPENSCSGENTKENNDAGH